MYPSPEQIQFLNAAERGDAATVQKFLAAGVDVNTRDDRRLPKNRTALMHAAINGHLAVMEALLSAGAELDARDRGMGPALPGGNTALLLAVKNKQVRSARRLLEAGADPRLASAGVTVLGEAAYLGDPALLRKLVKSGLDLNGPATRRTDLPLASALYGRQTEAVRVLLSAGADPNRISRGILPMEIAIREDMTEAAQLLLHRGVHLDRLTAKGLTLLTLAAQHGRKELVEILLSRGAPPNARCRNGQTALDAAIRCLERSIQTTTSGSSRSPDSAAPEPLSRLQQTINLLRSAGARTSDELPRTGKSSVPPGPEARPRRIRPAAVQAAGIRDFLELTRFTEPDFSLVALEAPIGKAATAFADFRRIRRWVADVPRQKATGLRHTGVAWVTAVKTGAWTVIFRSQFRLGPDDASLAVEDAKELSARLKTRAVAFVRESATNTIGFDLFQNGHPSECASWTEHGPLRLFKSRFRRRPAPEDSAEDYIDRIFSSLGIYLPACYPRLRRNGPVLCVERASLPAVERADLLALPRLQTRRRPADA